MPKHTYYLQCPFNGEWHTFTEGSRSFCEGYLDGASNYAPRAALRILRSDGKVIDELDPQDDVNLGMIAGFPTAEQYERAAKNALDVAQRIRENQQRHEKRHQTNQEG